MRSGRGGAARAVDPAGRKPYLAPLSPEDAMNAKKRKKKPKKQYGKNRKGKVS